MRHAAAAVTAALALTAPLAARAGGFEYPDNGTVGFGRAGAFTAQPTDPSALMYNTAGIVGLPGLQVSVSGNLAFLNNCFQRAGNYDAGGDNAAPGVSNSYNVSVGGTRFQNSTYDNGTTRYPSVCNQGGAFVAPQVLVTYRINRTFAVGLGLYGPNSIGNQSFPDTVTTANGMSAPSPARYILLNENLLIIHPTLAFAGAPVPWLRLGVAIQPSYASFHFATVANALSGSAQSPDGDIQTSANASGWFLAYNLGAQFMPSPYFTLGAHVHVNPSQISLAGQGTAVANYYAQPATGQQTSPFSVDRMTAALPVQARLGARFALPRDPRLASTRDGADPSRDEYFDVELDGIFESSSSFQALSLQNSGSVAVGPVHVPLPNAVVAHNWNNVWGARLGGDVNIVPGVFALRAGASYETGAQNTTDANLDIASYNTLGVHGGASVHFGIGRTHWTLSAGFAHFFMQSIDTTSTGALATIGTMGNVTATDCMTAGPGACHNNAGVFSASLNSVSAGLTAAF